MLISRTLPPDDSQLPFPSPKICPKNINLKCGALTSSFQQEITELAGTVPCGWL